MSRSQLRNLLEQFFSGAMPFPESCDLAAQRERLELERTLERRIEQRLGLRPRSTQTSL